MKRIAWTLDSIPDGIKNIIKVLIDRSPFTIGRSENASLLINKPDISRLHAEITFTEDNIFISDLNSKNGTFVNHKKVKQITSLSHGDIIHFGSNEYRIMRAFDSDQILMEEETTVLRSNNTLSNQLPVGLPLLDKLLNNELVTAVFQPIHNSDSSIAAVESLGRGTLDGLPSNPLALFKLAESGNLEIELSSLFRRIGTQIAFAQRSDRTLFVNTHPSELQHIDSLLDSLSSLTQARDQNKLVLEIHENGISEIAKLRTLVEELRNLNVGLAFDDFGAGQSRLRELLESPPDYVKFDMWLIRDIDTAPETKKNMLRSLVEIANDSETKTLAEGVETKDEFECCKDMGINLFQGFFFSMPESKVI